MNKSARISMDEENRGRAARHAWIAVGLLALAAAPWVRAEIPSPAIPGGTLPVGGISSAGGGAVPVGLQGVQGVPENVPPPNYRIAPNDELAIDVRDRPDLSLSEAVRGDGKIDLPLLGDLKVSGFTVTGVRDEIVRRLASYIRRPDVTVIIASYHRQDVYVLGNVRAYGAFAFSPGMSVREAFNLGGGADATADLSHLQVIRDHKTVAVLDLTDDANPAFALKPGDMLFIPPQPDRAITVVGAVGRVGSQPLLPHERLLDALTAAGGPAGSAAAASGDTLAASGGSGGDSWRGADLLHVTLTRKSGVLVIDGEALLNGDARQNALLESGDVIDVPPAAHVIVVGDVDHAGPQDLSPREKLLSALTAAGVASVRTAAASGGDVPDLSHVTITRQGKTQMVDVAAIFSGDLSGDLDLEPGDVIYVPPAARITLVGAVEHSGAQTLTSGERLLDAITGAGLPQAASAPGVQLASAVGVTVGADLSRVTLTREGRVQVIDVSTVLKGDLTNDLLLQAGDVIYVPPAPQIMVVGDVEHPGAQSAGAGEFVLEAVTAAGIPGPSPSENAGDGHEDNSAAPDLSHVTLTRQGEVRTLDLSAVLKGDLKDNLALQPGDVIYVPAIRPGAVTVLGEITHPQTVHVAPGSKVLDLINLAGGLGPHPDPDHAVLHRADGSTQTLNLQSLLAGKDDTQNVLLQDGDILTVPVSKYQIAVLGQVARPGVVDFQPGDDVLQATLLAGGVTPQASLNDVTIVRYDSNNAATHQTVNLSEIIKRGNRTTDEKLAPGDVIYVGSKSQANGSLLGSAFTAAELFHLFLP